MTKTQTIIIIAAMSNNNVIGYQGKMPWKISSDLQRFKLLTLGNPIIMGYNTFKSIGKALPDRLNIVVTHNIKRKYDLHDLGIQIAISIQDALDIAFKTGSNKVFIIGGGEIYAQTIDLAHILQITHVEAETKGDVFFPFIDSLVWQKQGEIAVPQKKEIDSHSVRFVTYTRRA
ncbi:MAG: diacylglycerol kinase [Candidatus Liberibacter europaeus]|uniref:Dihydrofolate reductase n=1 Tax=Candidatus Liberibacter europaeus TaxID=744859 RepID=A0A2T4VX11_9HYPH|nr:diacylglycerol kinase [Candidatus Liberibacter europaeus]PTL86314.1 MAG: diacylglycerol kinase [Candidatus Liberibacter europaeus]